MNNFCKTILKKFGLIFIIKHIARKLNKWGKYPCMCVEAPKSAMGVTANLETGKVTHFWCSDCGGYRKTKGKYRIEIENKK